MDKILHDTLSPRSIEVSNVNCHICCFPKNNCLQWSANLALFTQIPVFSNFGVSCCSSYWTICIFNATCCITLYNYFNHWWLHLNKYLTVQCTFIIRGLGHAHLQSGVRLLLNMGVILAECPSWCHQWLMWVTTGLKTPEWGLLLPRTWHDSWYFIRCFLLLFVLLLCFWPVT